MPKKPTLTEAALQALGPKTLAALELEAGDCDSSLEKKVCMVLVAKEGAGALDAELGKRIKSLTTG